MGAISSRLASKGQRGFTLLELLVVLVIAGLTLGMVSFNAMPSEQQDLQNDARRIALLLQLARDEAIVRNRHVSFEADEKRYRFLVREEGKWQAIKDAELLREREFNRAPVALSIKPELTEEAGPDDPLRIIFGREPVDKPFVLTLASGDSFVEIHADGIGHFVVE